MIREQTAVAHSSPDPGAWVDEHGDYLFRYAMFRLRETTTAEDAVQETLLAALQAYDTYAGRGSERAWLTGILKHKLTDHFRRLGRETPLSRIEGEEFEHGEFFRPPGDEWEGHWAVGYTPSEWCETPESLAEQGEFFRVLDDCLSPLPARVSGAFVLREVDGLGTEEICRKFGVSANNLWVMLHRARLHLRRCLELNWLKPGAVKH
ncbi:MAG TPA: sigma-70 family RNA polymerase sigma factor [Pyrinomonadaceae bacterium]